MENKVLNLIGLAYRAHKIILGGDTIVEALKNNLVSLVVMDKALTTDAARQIKNKCDYHNIDLVLDFSTEEISKAIGKTDVGVIGLTDTGFSKAIMKLLQ